MDHHQQRRCAGQQLDRPDIYLSSDSSIGSDTLYGTFTFNGVLNPGESVTRTQNITLPANQQGDRYVVVYTDNYNVLYEELENNNNAIDQQKMAVVLPPLPNLQVESVTAATEAFSGQQTVVEWVVTNAGTGDTSVPTWYDYVYLSSDGVLDAFDTYLGYAVNPSYLAVGDGSCGRLRSRCRRVSRAITRSSSRPMASSAATAPCSKTPSRATDQQQRQSERQPDAATGSGSHRHCRRR